MDYRELLTKAKSTNHRKGSGLRAHIREVLTEVPDDCRQELQGSSLRTWTRFLTLALREKYPEAHKGDRNLYSKVRVNLVSWGAFEVSVDGVRYLGW